MNGIESITVAPTRGPQAAPGRFELALQGATRSLAASVVGAVEVAAPIVPFGTVLAGAVRGSAVGEVARGPGLVARVAAGGAGAASGAVAGAGLGGAASGGSAAAASPASGANGDLIEATRALQQEAQAMNLQYLQLQEQLQRESREYTALSNVMKVKHDAARAAISNIH